MGSMDVDDRGMFGRPPFTVLAGRGPQVAAACVVAVVAILGALLVGLNLPVVLGLLAVVLGGAFAIDARRDRAEAGPGRPLARFALHVGVVGIAVLVLIQAVPHGRAHENPPITGEPAWADPAARDLMVRACFGCHSNEVEWPWYSNVAPVSWAVTEHVNDGRDAVNYSEFDKAQDEADETVEVILEGSMPPAYYTRFGLHPEANLTAQERSALVSWLRDTPGLSEDNDEYDDDDDDDDDDD